MALLGTLTEVSLWSNEIVKSFSVMAKLMYFNFIKVP